MSSNSKSCLLQSKIILLLGELPQKIILYFIMEWK
jgi:hypothetical protein